MHDEGHDDEGHDDAGAPAGSLGLGARADAGAAREDWQSGGVWARWTSSDDGDLAVTVEPELRTPRERAVVALPWQRCRQVHGAGALVVGGADVHALPVADALVGDLSGVALAVAVADCGPVALASPEGVMGVVHAGWRGVLAGVLPSAVAAMRALGAREVVAALGPCIHPCCYPFGREELTGFADRFGPRVIGEDVAGRPALDLPAAIAASLERSGVALAATSPTCTACGGRHFSHRRDRTPARNALAVWLA